MMLETTFHRKGSPQNWLNVMSEAQELGLTTSATNVFGFGESIKIVLLTWIKLETYKMILSQKSW